MGGGRVIEANDRSGREEKRRRAQTAAKLLCHFHWSHPHLPIQPAPLVYQTSFTFLIMYASGFLFAASPLLWLWPQKPTPLWHNIWVIAPKFSILIPFPCFSVLFSIWPLNQNDNKIKFRACLVTVIGSISNPSKTKKKKINTKKIKNHL